jgi:hypothetical protein
MPKKRLSLYLLIVLLVAYSSFAFPVKGIVLNDETQQPIAYANIGIVDKNVGTVSGPDGKYVIEIPEGLATDSLRFSSIGYVSRSLAVSEVSSKLNERQELIVDLMPQPVTFGEIRIGAIKPGTETVGGKDKVGNAVSPFPTSGKPLRESLGAEKGVFIQSKKYPASLQSIRVHISQNEFDSLTFRINVYSIKDGLPTQTILKENILFYVPNQQKGWITVDVMEYNLEINDDCIVSLEWLNYRTQRSETEKKLSLSYNNSTDSVLYLKTASQQQWEKSPGLLNLQVKLAY